MKESEQIDKLGRSAGSTIQGYRYQFDLTILQILNTKSGAVVVEGLEDFDIHTKDVHSANQVKYLEKGHYSTPKTLREPILLMLDAFNNGFDYNFILHVYFGDGSKPPSAFTVDNLRTCLTEHKKKPTPKIIFHYEKYPDKVLEEFVKRLSIRSGLARDEQQKQVTAVLAHALRCPIEDVDELHYGNALKFVEDLATEKTAHDRKVTRATFLSEINKRQSLYTRWHKEVVGQDRYVSTLTSRIKSSGSLRANRTKAVQISLYDADQKTFNDTVEMIEILGNSSYGVGRLTSTKPWTVIVDASNEQVVKLKIAMLKNGIVFQDGYEELEFQKDIFSQLPVFNTKGSSIIKTSYNIRIMNMSSAQSYIDAGYQFDIVMVTNEMHASLIKKGSKNDPVYIYGLEQEYINRILKELK